MGFVAVYLVANGIKAWRDHAPTLWMRARDEYATRQIFFAGVLKNLMPRALSTAQTHEFQVDCLYLIAEYARAWQWDLEAKKIFANLIVVDPGGTTVTVIARDREKPLGATRPVPKTYKMAERQAVKRCLESGKICEVGDLNVELPEYPREDYRNIVVLPLRKTPLGPVDAVVSIDSSERYHFSLEAKLLETHLQPYLSALECTL
jgi:hypothetical protein